MRKRTKLTQAKPVEFQLSNVNPDISPPLIEPIKERHKTSGINQMVCTDTPKQEQSIESDDLKLLHRQNPNEDGDGRGIDNEMTKFDGWRKIDFHVDDQLPICKDYYETGYCTFGASCKFLHTRDDLTTSSQYERRIAFSAFKTALDKSDNKVTTVQPDICPICKKYFKNPVITKCGHKFCNTCAIQRFRNDRTCAVCGYDTHGIFNTVRESSEHKT